MNPSKPAHEWFGGRRRGLVGAAAPILKRVALVAIFAGLSLASPNMARAQQQPAPAPETTQPQPPPSGEAGEAPQQPAPTPAPNGEPAPAPTTEPAPPAEQPPAEQPPPAEAGASIETRIRPPAPPRPVVRKVTTPIVVAGIISGVALGTGVFFAIDAVGKHSEYQKKPDHEVGVAGERSAFIADVSFGVAALFGFTALAMYLLPDEPDPDAAAAATSSTTKGSSKKASWLGSALKGEILRF